MSQKTLRNPMVFRYRPATSSDADTIVEFQLAMALETENLKLDRQTCKLGVEKVFKTPGIGSYYICEGHQGVVGSLLILPEWSDWRNGSVWWIHSVYLKPEIRGQGLFKEFYRYIKVIVNTDESLRGLRLYVDKRNVHAQKVYQKIGMVNHHYELYEWMKTF